MQHFPRDRYALGTTFAMFQGPFSGRFSRRNAGETARGRASEQFLMDFGKALEVSQGDPGDRCLAIRFVQAKSTVASLLRYWRTSG